MLGHGLGMMTVGVAAVVGQVQEMMKTAGKPEVYPVLAVGLVYKQDE